MSKVTVSAGNSVEKVMGSPGTCRAGHQFDAGRRLSAVSGQRVRSAWRLPFVLLVPTAASARLGRAFAFLAFPGGRRGAAATGSRSRKYGRGRRRAAATASRGLPHMHTRILMVELHTVVSGGMGDEPVLLGCDTPKPVSLPPSKTELQLLLES